MTILYSLVSRKDVVLAEFTPASGNFPQIVRSFLPKLSVDDGRMSYTYDNYVFHYCCEDTIIYLAMCDEVAREQRRVPFAFLDDIKSKFVSMYGDKAQTAIAFSMNKEFSKTLKKQMEFFNSPSGDSFSTLNSKIDEVKNVMYENIESVLARGEKLEILVDKSEALQQQAFVFQRSARDLKSAMWWRQIKIYLLIFALVVVFILIISMVACGVDFGKCKNDDNK
tara:strand:- start:698 stop:1369 length:672 start_codon:yes stop_codon:yes gene_type:complete